MANGIILLEKHCPFCNKQPQTRYGVCEGELEIAHKCLMGHVVNRGDFGDVWKTKKRVIREWNKICDKAVAEFTKRVFA